jgi:hypothetical protein
MELDPSVEKVVAAAERFANVLISARQLGAIRGRAKIREKKERILFLDQAILTLEPQAYLAAYWTAERAVSDGGSMGNPGDEEWVCPEIKQWQAYELRRFFGENPFRPQPKVDPAILAWKDRTIPKLAQAIFDERIARDGKIDDPSLAVLADALEEAGCADAAILNTCRQPKDPHDTIFWMVDLLVRKR